MIGVDSNASKEKTIEKFIKGNLNEVEVIILNISDYVMEYTDKELKFDKLIRPVRFGFCLNFKYMLSL